MKYLFPVAALLAGVAAPALAQRPPSTQEQILILQQQLSASQASATSLAQRLDAVERQLQQLVNLEEQNGHRVSVVESNVNRIKSDSDSRMNAIEQKIATLSAPPPQPQTSDETTQDSGPKEAAVTSKPKGDSASKSKIASASKSKKTQMASADLDKAAASAKDEPDSSSSGVGDPGEDAYTQGYHLWAAGDYPGAVKSLTAFASQYPKHPRVSWARNLIGRALLDEGQPRAAAEAFLANYRSDPGGGRAQDSLYYLGQSLMKLGQPAQACKAYAELESVYGTKVRPDIRSMLPKARADANCQ